MQKIGLLTFHRTTNFGSYLQTYGLYKKISDMGYCCEIIDYRCPAVEKRENLNKNTANGLKDLLKRILFQYALDRKAKALSAFSMENMNFSRPYTPENINEANSDFDVFIVGSDIVWGLDITECDYNYFLKFVADGKRMYAFSSSVGTENKEHMADIGSLLRRFDRITVRESSMVKWVKEISGCNAEWVCDPTMLLDADEWKTVIPFEQLESDYVLVYFNNPDKKTIRDAIEYGTKYGKKVLYISYGLPESGVKNIKPKSLNEFLSYIFYADHIFTASYHGMLFSLYFNKEMTFYTRDHADRMISLSERLGIQEQCGDNKTEKSYKPIPYETVDLKINEFRQESISVLKKMLLG